MAETPERHAVDRLLRGISTDHVETVRDAWRAALAEGPQSVPVIRSKLATSLWEENPRGPLPRYLGVLLSLLDTLDPAAFEEEIGRLEATRLHPIHRLTVETLAQRLRDDPVARVAHGIPVYVSSEIPGRAAVARAITGWSGTRGLSLEGVTRIDVVARRPELDYLGRYSLFFSGIILTWPPEPAGAIARWWRRLEGEFTFYHEAGHHVSGHIEGGTMADQEREADAYATRMMRTSRPVLFSVACVLVLPFRPLLRRTDRD